MANTVMLKARGLYTFANYLSSIPEGSLLQADNTVIDRDGIIEPRRGITQYGSIGTISTDLPKQLLTYKDRILAHYGSSLAYDNGSGTFTDFAGSFPELQSGLRIKAIEMNGNFYVTTADGIKKIAAATNNLSLATVSDAGGVKALDLQAIVNYENPGFFLGYSKVAYRLVWGINDINENLVLGSPSSRTVVTNFSPESATVDLTSVIPQEADSVEYFYQLYRTTVTTAATFADINDLEPGDEMKLVYEANLTAADLIAGVINIHDITPEDFQSGGTPLYTNPISGDGILQANEKPPVARDIAIYKNSAFYANTRTRNRLDVTLLGLGGMNFADITVIATGNPSQITAAGHGLTTGDRVVILGSNSTPSVDGEHIVTVLDPNNFTIPINVTIAGTEGRVFSSYIEVAQGMTVNRYFFVGRREVTDATFDTQANTTDGGYFLINSAENEYKYFIWFDKTGTTLPPSASDTEGRIGIRVDISTGVTTDVEVAEAVANAVFDNSNDFIIDQVGALLTFSTANNGTAGTVDFPSGVVGATSPGGVFAISVTQEGFGEDVANRYVRLSGYESAAQAVDDTARSLTNVVNQNPNDIIYIYYLSGPDDVPGIMNFEARALNSAFFTVKANNATVGALFNPDLSTIVSSFNEDRGNRLYFSKAQQPEAVPLTNYVDIGPKDKKILRIVALRDSLFIMKEDGIYRLTGDIAPNFTIALFDNSSNLTAPDTAAVLNNQIYMLTTQGIATVTETGVGIISRPIENVFLQVTSSNYPNFSTASFAVGYETDRSYLIWTVTNTGDTFATQCFRYNTFTQAWTRWDKPQRCGIVRFDNNKLYVGATDTNLIEIERKTLNRTDYADRQFPLQINNNPVVAADTLTISSAANVEPGDALAQIQYLSINDYNALLQKIDNDPRIGITTFDTDYFTTLEMVEGDNLTNSVQNLVIKLNADPGTSSVYTFNGSSSFPVIQSQWNAIVTTMNADPLLKFTNYQLSTGTVTYELTIDSVNKNTNTVKTLDIPPLVVGPIIHYVSIKAKIVWAPLFFGDPSFMKHIRESTTMFESTAFRSAKMSYNTDLSPAFEGVTFGLEGNGVWGGFFWGESTWGGQGTAVPFRTYIPRQKQRCRFIRAKFEHMDAFYKFSILGISYTYESTSERAYRGT